MNLCDICYHSSDNCPGATDGWCIKYLLKGTKSDTSVTLPSSLLESCSDSLSLPFLISSHLYMWGRIEAMIWGLKEMHD